MLPWNTWLRQQYLDSRIASSSQRRVLKPAQARVLWDDVVASSTIASQLLNASSAARLAARSWRLLHDYLIPIDSLQAFDGSEAQALNSWCGEFDRRCNELNSIDEAMLSHWAFEMAFKPDRAISLAGFDAVTPAMQRLVDRWRGEGLMVDAEDGTSSNTMTSVFAAADRETEIEDAAQWARSRVINGDTNVGIIVPDLQARADDIRRVFEDVLAPNTRQTGSSAMSLPFVVAAPIPLSSYPLVDAAMLLLQLVAGASSVVAGRVLRSPFLKGGESERGKRALADLRLREEQRDAWDWPLLERWAGMHDCDSLQLAAREVNALIRSIGSSAAPSEWAERFHSLWLAAGWPGDRSLDSAEFQTLKKFQDALAEFGSLDVVAGRMNLRRAMARLQELLHETPFEPEPGTSAITIIDAATSAGMTFDSAWIAGLDADRWPAAVAPDPLIPLDLQREAGIPQASPGGVLKQSKQQLDRWLSCADSVVLSWPERDGDIELSISPLLSQVQATATVSGFDRTSALRQQLFRDKPSLEIVRDDRAPPLTTREAKGGTRTIELQSTCPFRAQAELRLAAPPMPRVSLGVEAVDRGAILHRVLADVWGQLRTQQRLLSLSDVQVEQLVRESAQRHAMQALTPDTPSRTRLAMLEIESVIRQVVALLQKERARPPFSVHLAEAAESYVIGGLAITLRPDRIDVLEDGGELLIDYKLGASHQPVQWIDRTPGRPKSPQLPLYGLAHAGRLRGLAFAILAPGAVEYRGWSDGTPMGDGIKPYPRGIRIDFGDPSDWEALLHHWDFTLTRLAEHYVAGDAAVDPLPQACTYCHLSMLCRVHEQVADADDRESPNDE